MKKDKLIILLGILTLVIIIIGLVLLKKNIEMRSHIRIIDASYMCNQKLEKFYEDDKYIYYFPCVKSDAVYVEIDGSKKMLVVRALEDKIVTIDELINAGLEVQKNEK